jgi:hypothetical protein
MSNATLDSLKLKIEKFRADRPHKKIPFPDDIVRDVNSLLKTYKPGRLRRVAKVPSSLLKPSSSRASSHTDASFNLVRVAPVLVGRDSTLSVEISFAAGHSARVAGSLSAHDVSTILAQLAGGQQCSR